MCVKLITNVGSWTEYDQNRPLKEQLIGCDQILFDCVKDDKELVQFLQEMLININDIDLNMIAKRLSYNMKKTDDKLEEIATMCANRS